MKYEKNLTYPGINSNLSDDTLPSGVTSEEEQITKYQGFYIARYEAGVPENQTTIDGTSKDTSDVEGIPVSKKGAIVWTNVYNKVKINAESMINTDFVKSGLITGTMWDTVMLYLQNAGYDVASDSSGWGNYKNSSGNAAVVESGENKYGKKQTAGYSEYWSAKGIYDIAGNVYEYTNEKSYSYYFVRRGGHYDYTGAYYPASNRNGNSAAFTFVGFRVALYIM